MGPRILSFLKTLLVVFGICGAAGTLAWLGLDGPAKQVEGYKPDRVSITEVIGG